MSCGVRHESRSHDQGDYHRGPTDERATAAQDGGVRPWVARYTLVERQREEQVANDAGRALYKHGIARSAGGGVGHGTRQDREPDATRQSGVV